MFDKENELVMHVVGKTEVYDKVKTTYKTKLSTKEEANKFYKLLKALFILQTELPHYYKFDTQIGKNGELIFEYNSKLIEYDNLSKFIKEQYKKYAKELKEIFKQKEVLDLQLEKSKNEEKEKNLEYIWKEKQVATYLECKTTMFGKIKYFFKSKNAKFIKKKEKEKNNSKQIKEKNKIEKDISSGIIEDKEYYTIEDLIKVCLELDIIRTKIKNVEMDLNALKDKIKSIDNKIKNATLYLQKIEEHKKSIFEFWKFANRDETLSLNSGEQEKTDESSQKISKTFDYEEDLEDLGIMADRMQRDKLTRKECNAIFLAATPEILNDINKIKSNNKISEENLIRIKEEAEKEIILFGSEKFDIFGNVKEDKTKINILANKKHREVKKDKFKILDLSKNMTLEEYTEKIKEQYQVIEKAIEKIKAITDVNIYTTSNEKLETNKIGKFHINPMNSIGEDNSEKVNLYKIKLKEGINLAYYTNIMYYDNEHNTLPVGMNIDDYVLFDMSLYNLKLKKQKVLRINEDIDEINNKTKLLCIYEYEIEIKDNNKNE